MLTHRSIRGFFKAACTIALAIAPSYLHADSFTQTNLVSNIPGFAAVTDPNLKNPWGVSFTATSPFWVSNQVTGTATLYDGAGNITPLVVTIPGGGPPSGPTGQINNAAAGFLVNNAPARFIFDSLNGTITGWNGGTTAVQVAATPGAIYTGLAQATSGASTFLYAANTSGTGNIHVFDSGWTDVSGTTFAGKFVDPTLPAGFVPFNVQNIGGFLYVTYASLLPGGIPLPGGFVDEYDAAGNFIKRIASSGPLSAPWGLTIAPSNFGLFSNDLLIGNFGNGQILAYDFTTDSFLGTINGPDGQPLVNDHLWALATRTGGTNDNLNAVYFTAGIHGEADGLFGDITATPVPEPATILEAASGLIAFCFTRIRRRAKQ